MENPSQDTSTIHVPSDYIKSTSTTETKLHLDFSLRRYSTPLIGRVKTKVFNQQEVYKSNLREFENQRPRDIWLINNSWGFSNTNAPDIDSYKL